MQGHHDEFAVAENGIYNITDDPAGWVLHNAKISWDYFPCVSQTGSKTSYRMATSILLHLAQRTSAGFFLYFLNKANL